MSTITINGITYNIEDTIEKITVADSFVVRSNKLGGGHGEAKLYVGNNNEQTRDFFGNKGFQNNCFLLKKDLLKFLEEAESEYKNPEQPYQDINKLHKLWKERKSKVKGLDDFIEFTIIEQTQLEGPRVYVKSNDHAYKLLRELSLPNITYISIMKLTSPQKEVYYYFRLFIDYFGDNAQHPSLIEDEINKIEQENISEKQKSELKNARNGQGKYREALLEDCPFCPITLVADDRLLKASHIKPWVESDDNEKTDPKNGFMLTPTFDHMFDRGFISFNKDKSIKISPWLSRITCKRLGIKPDKKYQMLPIEGREDYLEYHRENIFKE